jgi:hypothetical protein
MENNHRRYYMLENIYILDIIAIGHGRRIYEIIRFDCNLL